MLTNNAVQSAFLRQFPGAFGIRWYNNDDLITSIWAEMPAGFGSAQFVYIEDAQTLTGKPTPCHSSTSPSASSSG